jgi:hypothetical protein
MRSPRRGARLSVSTRLRPRISPRRSKFSSPVPPFSSATFLPSSPPAQYVHARNTYLPPTFLPAAQRLLLLASSPLPRARPLPVRACVRFRLRTALFLSSPLPSSLDPHSALAFVIPFICGTVASATAPRPPLPSSPSLSYSVLSSRSRVHPPFSSFTPDLRCIPSRPAPSPLRSLRSPFFRPSRPSAAVGLHFPICRVASHFAVGSSPPPFSRTFLASAAPSRPHCAVIVRSPFPTRLTVRFVRGPRVLPPFNRLRPAGRIVTCSCSRSRLRGSLFARVLAVAPLVSRLVHLRLCSHFSSRGARICAYRRRRPRFVPFRVRLVSTPSGTLHSPRSTVPPPGPSETFFLP